MLNQKEIDFLRVVAQRSSTGDPIACKLPISERIRSLINRGYIRTVEYYGDPRIMTTEAGRFVLRRSDEC